MNSSQILTVLTRSSLNSPKGFSEENSDTISSKSANDNSTSTQSFRLQFENKVLESTAKLESQSLRTKLEEQSITLHKLHFDEEPIGRKVEIQKIHSKLAQFISTQKTCVLSIVGTSGTGKTLLAKQLKKPTLKAGGFFGLGKFDLQQQNSTVRAQQPYAAFMGASYEIAEQIIEHDESTSSEAGRLQKAIHDAVGDQGIDLLLEVFPGLSKALLSKTVESSSNIVHTNIEQKTNQLQFTVRQLFRILSSKDSPLVLVVDDVQWADAASLNLLETLVMDRETSFLLVATVRDGEISQDHPFQRTCKAIENLDAEAVDTVSIRNLSPSDLQSIVANSLRESEDYVKGLADIVHEKTHGNPFFCVELLQMLVSEDLLTYSMGMMKWLWEDGAIQGVHVTDNVGSLLARRIKKLPNAPQSLLKVAGCLGQKFGVQTLLVALECLFVGRVLETSVIGDVNDASQQCIDAGLLDKTGSQFNFVHDQIQQAAITLVTEEERPKFQLVIGQGLLKHLSEIENDEIDTLFLAVDLCNSSSSLMGHQGMLELGYSNWDAARNAMDKSAFDSAIGYGKAGLLCLKEVETAIEDGEDSRRIRSLRLKLQTTMAEASYCTGDRPATEAYAQKITDADCSFHDKFDGYITLMLSQFSQQKLKEATDTSMFILNQLGFFRNAATTPSILRVLLEIIKTKATMRKLTQEDLMNLPPMRDENRLRAIRLIIRTTNMTFTSNPNLFLVQTLTAMRWTVKYGVSEYSPPILAVYALVVCGVLEDFDTGVMIGDAALALAEKLKAIQTMAFTTQVVFSFSNHWKNDLRRSRKPFEFAARTGFQMGDVNNAMTSLISLRQNSLFSGYHNLKDLADLTREDVIRMRSYGQEFFAIEQCLTLQFVLNLRGQAEDPLVLTGEAMNQEEAVMEATETDHKLVPACVASFTGILGYMYENHEFAVVNLSKVKKEDCLAYVSMPRHFSWLALTHLALALEGKRAKHNLKKGQTIMKMLKKYVVAGNINIRHFVNLIEAEIAALKKPSTAAPLYEEAIRFSGRVGFRNDIGAIHARAARFFFFIQKDIHWGCYHLDKAIESYSEWGADGVAKNLAKNYPMYIQGFSTEIKMSPCMEKVVFR